MNINPTTCNFQGKTKTARLTEEFGHYVDRHGKKIIGKSKKTIYHKDNVQQKQKLRHFNSRYSGISLDELKAVWRSKQEFFKKAIMPPF